MRTGVLAVVSIAFTISCSFPPQSSTGNTANHGGGAPVIGPNVQESASASASGAPQASYSPAVATMDCSSDGAVTTCNPSTNFSLIIDLKTQVRSAPGMDLVKIDEEYFPFTPGVLIATLGSRNGLNTVLDRFGLKVSQDLDPRVSTQGPHAYAFETVIDDSSPNLVGLRSLVEKSGISGRYVFYSNSGARMFLLTLKMLSEGASIGVVTAGLDLLYRENEKQGWGPITDEGAAPSGRPPPLVAYRRWVRIFQDDEQTSGRAWA